MHSTASGETYGPAGAFAVRAPRPEPPLRPEVAFALREVAFPFLLLIVTSVVWVE